MQKTDKIHLFLKNQSNKKMPFKGGRPPVRFFGKKRTDYQNVGGKRIFSPNSAKNI